MEMKHYVWMGALLVVGYLIGTKYPNFWKGAA